MERELRTRLPLLPHKLLPHKVDDKEVRKRVEVAKSRHKHFYDRHNASRELKPLTPDDNVFVREDNKWKHSGVIISGGKEHRTFLESTLNGDKRKNRVHLLKSRVSQTSSAPGSSVPCPTVDTEPNPEPSSTSAAKPRSESSGSGPSSPNVVRPNLPDSTLLCRS